MKRRSLAIAAVAFSIVAITGASPAFASDYYSDLNYGGCRTSAGGVSDFRNLGWSNCSGSANDAVTSLVNTSVSANLYAYTDINYGGAAFAISCFRGRDRDSDLRNGVFGFSGNFNDRISSTSVGNLNCA